MDLKDLSNIEWESFYETDNAIKISCNNADTFNDDSDINTDADVGVLIEFFLKYYEDELKLLLLNKDIDRHHSLIYNYILLDEFNMDVADILFNNPDIYFEKTDLALDYALERLRRELMLSGNVDKNMYTVKVNVHARIELTLLPTYLIRQTVSNIRSNDCNSVICITGTVIRTSQIRLIEHSRTYVCLKCNGDNTVYSDIIRNKNIEYPKQCSLLNSKGNKCKSKKFMPLNGSTRNIDFQEIYLQEQIKKLQLRKIPTTIKCILTCDLTDLCNAGDDVEIIGIVRMDWSNKWTIYNKKSSDVDKFDCKMYIEIKSIKVKDNSKIHDISDNVRNEYKSLFQNYWLKYSDNPINGRNRILANIAPQLYGMFIVKLATALTIIGGIPRYERETRIRGQTHLLLVGDPGTGKSQILRYASKMSNRCVLTTGIGTTSAGLTVSAVKDGGEFILEAGALVLGDGGICCIDEFGKVREHDRGVIHEAMEQQTISVAKGGYVCTLNSRTTVIAAMNPPPGGFDDKSTLSINVGMQSSLLSRFDILLLLLDRKNNEWDKKVGSHLMNDLYEPTIKNIDYMYGIHVKVNNTNNDDSIITDGLKAITLNDIHDVKDIDRDIISNAFNDPLCFVDINSGRVVDPETINSSNTSSNNGNSLIDCNNKEDRVDWNMEQMQAYFEMCKQINASDMTQQASLILTKYYQKQRRDELRDKSRTTIRLLESLMRLAQAHARLMFRNSIIEMDAIEAIHIMEMSIKTTHSIGTKSVLQNIFPPNGQQFYQLTRDTLLKSIGLNPNNVSSQVFNYKKYFQDSILNETLIDIDGGMFDDEYIPDDNNDYKTPENDPWNTNQINYNQNNNINQGNNNLNPQNNCNKRKGNNDYVTNIEPPKKKQKTTNDNIGNNINQKGNQKQYVTNVINNNNINTNNNNNNFNDLVRLYLYNII